MGYDNSNYESGDSMGQPTAGGSASSSNRKAKQSNSAVPSTSLCRCSYCDREFERSETKHMPFCSKRCQQIDLGMWLNESYGIPYEGDRSVDKYDAQSSDDDV